VLKLNRRCNVIPCFAAIGMLVLPLVQTARASIIFQIVYNNTSFSTTGPLGGTQFTPGLTVLNGLLSSGGAPYQFTSLSATSNEPLGTGNDEAAISITGSITDSSTNPPAPLLPITISVIDTNFTFPSTPADISSAAADTFAFSSAGDSRTFQSFFNPADTGTPGVGIPAPLITFDLSTSILAFGQTTGASIGTPVTPYALSNVTTITLAPGPNSAEIATDNFSGETIVTVPEPMTGALAATAGLLLTLRRRR
jgi:hypothetical protein